VLRNGNIGVEGTAAVKLQGQSGRKDGLFQLPVQLEGKCNNKLSRR